MNFFSKVQYFQQRKIDKKLKFLTLFNFIEINPTVMVKNGKF